jgi:hypothetical protein
VRLEVLHELDVVGLLHLLELVGREEDVDPLQVGLDRLHLLRLRDVQVEVYHPLEVRDLEEIYDLSQIAGTVSKLTCFRLSSESFIKAKSEWFLKVRRST